MHSNYRLSQLLSQLEKLPGPCDAIIGDTWIWPLIRAQILYKSMLQSHVNKSLKRQSFFRTLKCKWSAYWKILKQAFSYPTTASLLMSQIKKNQDVVSMVLPSRWKSGAKDISERDQVVGKILSNLGMRGVRISLWTEEDCIDQLSPGEGIVSFSRVFSCAGSLLRLRQYFLRVPKEPLWHKLLTRNCQASLNIELDWHETFRTYLYIEHMRKIFHEAFLISRPRILVTCCWYNYGVMASILAAKNLGIKVVEVQHGIQENTHPCYHNWLAKPAAEGAIHSFPDSIMVWGPMSKSLYMGHSLVKEIVVAGSASINENLNPSVKSCKLRQGKLIKTLSIGYTLTWPLEPLIGDLEATIKSCPASWSWILRLHPSDSFGNSLLKKLILENPQFNVLVSKPSEQTIAEFFESVDVHLSHESSCSLQAFAFGMPTLITTYQGAKNFKFWIDQSLMFYNSDCSDLCESIQMLLEIEPGRAFEAAREVFGSDSDFRQAISYLIASLE